MTKKLISIFFIFGIFLFRSDLIYDNSTPFRYFFIALAFIVVLFFLGKKKRSLNFHLVHYIFIGFLIIEMFSFFYASNRSVVYFPVACTCLIFIGIIVLPPLFKDFPEIKFSILKGVVLVTFIWNLFGLYDLITLSENLRLPEKDTYRIASLLDNKNLYASCLMLTLPLQGILFLKSSFKWRIVILVSFFISLFMMLHLQTRSVIVVLIWFAVLLLVIGLYCLIKKNSIWLKIKQNKKWIIASFIIFFSVVIIESSFINRSVIPKNVQPTQVNTVQINSVNERLFLWDHSFKMFKEDPLLGVGCGNWKVAINKFGLPDSAWWISFLYPHNDYISVLCETGLIGMIFYLFFFFFVLFTLVKMILKQENFSENLFIFLGLSGYCIYAFFEYPKERPEHLFLMILFVSFALSGNNVFSKNSKTFDHKLKKIFIGAALLIVFYFISLIRVNYYFLELNKNRFSGNWTNVLKAANKVNTSFFDADMDGVPINWYKGIALYSLSEFELARIEFEEAKKHYPFNINVLNNLASSQTVLGKPDLAKANYIKAIELSPGFDEARINYCIVLYNEGKLDLCKKELKKLTDRSLIQKNLEFIIDVIDPQKVENIKSVDQIVKKLAD